jgi:Yip1 domain
MEGEGVQSASVLPGLPTRFIQAVVSPGKLFRALRAEPKVLAALVLGAVVAALASSLLPAESYEPIIRAQITRAGGEMPANMGRAVQFAKWGSVVGALVVWPIIGVLLAAFNVLVFKIALGYQGSFKQYLSVTAHALLVAAVGTLAFTPARILAQNPQMTLSVGALVPGLEEGLVARFLGYLDLFNLWATMLIGYGASILDGKRGAGASVAYALIATGLVAIVIASFTG